MVLGKMKETAESFLGEKVTKAVVTVPACTSRLRFRRVLCVHSFPSQTSTMHNAKLQRTPAR